MLHRKSQQGRRDFWHSFYLLAGFIDALGVYCVFLGAVILISVSLCLCLCHRGAALSHLKGRSRMPHKFACWVRLTLTDLNTSALKVC